MSLFFGKQTCTSRYSMFVFYTFGEWSELHLREILKPWEKSSHGFVYLMLRRPLWRQVKQPTQEPRGGA